MSKEKTMNTCRTTRGRFKRCPTGTRNRSPIGARAPRGFYRAAADGYDEDELVLFGDNDEPTYRMLQTIRTNLRKHMKRGRFDRAKAVVGFVHGADFADKRYSREVYRDRNAKGFNFSPAQRRAAAEQWVVRFFNGETGE